MPGPSPAENPRHLELVPLEQHAHRPGHVDRHGILRGERPTAASRREAPRRDVRPRPVARRTGPRTPEPLKTCAVSGGRANNARMLTTLRISGFAIVDAVEVRFGPGLNVLTGETGAGKSILVNALHLVLGGRMSAEVLRDGADEAVVEALFELPAAHPVFGRLEAAGLAAPRRQAEGTDLRAPGAARRGARRARARLRERRALHRLDARGRRSAGVVDISGQHEHVSLLDPATRTSTLARRRTPGSTEHLTAPDGAEPLLLRYRAAHAALAALVRERETPRRGRGRAGAAGRLPRLPAAGARRGRSRGRASSRRSRASGACSPPRRSCATRRAPREALAYGEEGSASERVAQAARALAEAGAPRSPARGAARAAPLGGGRARGGGPRARPLRRRGGWRSGAARERGGSARGVARPRAQARRVARRSDRPARRDARGARPPLGRRRAAARARRGDRRAREAKRSRSPRSSPGSAARRRARSPRRWGASSRGSRWAAAGWRWRCSRRSRAWRPAASSSGRPGRSAPRS